MAQLVLETNRGASESQTIEVYLVRHAEAEARDAARWPDDSDRPITARGAKRLRSFLLSLRCLPDHFELVATSPLVRARQTADILGEVALWGRFEEWPELEPKAYPSDVLERIRATRFQRIALVGHQPQMSALLSVLLTGSPDELDTNFKKGAVALIAWDPRPGNHGKLEWLESP